MRVLLIVSLVSLACACAKSSPPVPVISIAGLNEAQQCVRELRKLQAAASIGTNQLNYDPLLINAKASCDEAERKLASAQLRNEIDESMRAYVDAADLWSNWLKIDPRKSPYNGWQVKYGLAQTSFAPESVPVIWHYAGKHVDEAGRLLDGATR